MLSASNTLTPRAYLLLALLAALIFWPGQAQLPAIDRDEARFAQATKQMIQSGDYTDIRFQDQARHKKPAGIYWLQAAAIKVTGAMPTDLWAYRLPSYLAAIGAVLLTAAIGNMLFSGPVGALAALLLAGSLILNVEARMAKTDAMLLFTILAAQFALLAVWLRSEKSLGHTALFWAALAAGTLVKGPIIFLPVLATLIGLCIRDRSARLLVNLQPALGTPLFLALVAPWFVAITLKSGGAFWAESVGHDMLGKVASGKESHGMPPGYYLVTFWATFWPAAPAIAAALPGIWQRRKEDEFFALIMWVLPTWLVFEAVITKLPHYTLPTYPALAILAAAVWLGGLRSPRWWLILCGAIFALVTFGLLLGTAMLPLVANGTVTWLQIAVAAICLVGFGFVLRGTLMQRALLTTLLSALALGTLFGITLPQWKHIWIAKQVEAALAQETGCPVPYLISARFNEPSLVFHIGTQTMLDGTGTFAASYIAGGECQFALVDNDNKESFMATAKALNYVPQVMAHIAGFSYGGGDDIDMTLYKKGKE